MSNQLVENKQKHLESDFSYETGISTQAKQKIYVYFRFQLWKKLGIVGWYYYFILFKYFI